MLQFLSVGPSQPLYDTKTTKQGFSCSKRKHIYNSTQSYQTRKFFFLSGEKLRKLRKKVRERTSITQLNLTNTRIRFFDREKSRKRRRLERGETLIVDPASRSFSSPSPAAAAAFAYLDTTVFSGPARHLESGDHLKTTVLPGNTKVPST